MATTEIQFHIHAVDNFTPVIRQHQLSLAEIVMGHALRLLADPKVSLDSALALVDEATDTYAEMAAGPERTHQPWINPTSLSGVLPL